MTEKEFDRKVEEMAARFEQRIEASADRVEKGVNRRYHESRLFRFTIKGISIVAEIGLLIGAKHLMERGNKIAALGCAGIGVVGLVVEIICIVAFRRRR